MQDCRLCGALGVGVVAVIGLEEAGTIIVEAAELEIPELLANLIGHHETRIDDLPRLAVAKPAAILGTTDRVFYGTKEASERLKLVVFELAIKMNAHHTVVRERVAKRSFVMLPRTDFDANDFGDFEAVCATLF